MMLNAKNGGGSENRGIAKSDEESVSVMLAFMFCAVSECVYTICCDYVK